MVIPWCFSLSHVVLLVVLPICFWMSLWAGMAVSCCAWVPFVRQGGAGSGVTFVIVLISPCYFLPGQMQSLGE